MPTHRAGYRTGCGGQSPPQPLSGPCARPPVHLPPEENEWVLGLGGSPSNLWALLSDGRWLLR